jgi:hypothetical protein
MEEANDIPAQEIIVETLILEMRLMSDSQPVTFVLFQLLSYPPLDEDDEHKVREVSSLTHDKSYPTIEDIINDASSCDEEINNW